VRAVIEHVHLLLFDHGEIVGNFGYVRNSSGSSAQGDRWPLLSAEIPQDAGRPCCLLLHRRL